MTGRNYTYRIRGSDGIDHTSMRLQLIGDALLDARTLTYHGPGGLQTIEVLRQPGDVVVLTELRLNGRRRRHEEIHA